MAVVESSFRIVPPDSTDFRRVIEFMRACDVAEFGEPDTDEGDVADQWQTADLAQDAWLALDEKEALCGYALLADNGERGFSFDLYSLPGKNALPLREALVNRVLQRAGVLAHEKTTLVTYLSAFNQPACVQLEANGFRDHAHHYRMQIDFSAPLEPVVWPQGYTLHAVTPQDEQELYELISAAFDWPGHEPVSFDAWKKHLFREGRYDPQYFFLVKKEGKLVAAALSYNENSQGWVRQLAVSKDMQGQGLGSLLLRHVFSVYSQAKAQSVALGVASANEKAAHFYEHLGMRRSREFVEYHLEID